MFWWFALTKETPFLWQFMVIHGNSWPFLIILVIKGSFQQTFVKTNDFWLYLFILADSSWFFVHCSAFFSILIIFDSFSWILLDSEKALSISCRFLCNHIKVFVSAYVDIFGPYDPVDFRCIFVFEPQELRQQCKSNDLSLTKYSRFISRKFQ